MKTKLGRRRPFMYLAAVCDSAVMNDAKGIVASQFMYAVSGQLKIYRESFGVHSDNYPTALITEGLILNKTSRSIH
jgi:hypothetical protein